MRALLIVALLAGSAQADSLFRILGGAETTTGKDPSGPSDMQTGADLSETGVDLGVDWIILPGEKDQDVLGLRPTFYATTTFRIFAKSNADVDKLIPVQWQLGTGTWVPLVDHDATQLHLTLGTELRLFSADRAGTSSESMGFLGGIRFQTIAAGSFLWAQYQIAPFWFGADRIEHRFSLAATIPGTHFGAAAQYTLGQTRGTISGFTAHTFVVELEVIL